MLNLNDSELREKILLAKKQMENAIKGDFLNIDIVMELLENIASFTAEEEEKALTEFSKH